MIGMVVAAGLVALLIAMLLAPIEALGWWAGWYGEELQQPDLRSMDSYSRFGAVRRPEHYVVFLDGIAKVGESNYANVELFLERLARELPAAEVLGDVMPYSVRNVGLLENRPLAVLWRYAHRLKTEGRQPLINFLINIRNLMQVLVAADSRYGPIYGQGEAQLIANSLLKRGYEPASGVPVTIVGYSGGAQIALVAAPFLRRALAAPVSLISLGGIMSSDSGLMAVEHVWHLQGTLDHVPDIPAWILPGRWRLMGHSHWNRMLRENRFTRLSAGPMRHSGRGNYLDPIATFDGRSHVDHTAVLVGNVVNRIDARLSATVNRKRNRISD